MTGLTRTFNERTNIEQVNEYVRQSFCSSLPQSYRIIYYDTTTMSLVDLEDQLRNRLNPFQSNSSIAMQNIPMCTRLYVVNNSPISSHIYSSNLMQPDQIVFNDTDENSSIDETRTESNCFINCSPTNDDGSQDNNGYLSYGTENLSTTTIPSSIEHQQRHNILSNRLYFSLDVKPVQRNIYKSDEFSMRSEKLNGRIVRIQGIKADKQKMCQVLPRLRISSTAFQPNVTLLVIVVSEKIHNGIRIWYKHSHKGFLPDQYTKDTNPINPIEFNLNTNNITNNGDFILSLQMITKWNKSKIESKKIYQLDEQQVVQLHSAKHDSYSPRLLCVLQRDGFPDWNTFCLSDFIRSPKSAKKRSSSVVTERTYSPERKRSKINTNFNDIDQIVQ
ncbi:unnamed protein product [Rotaria sordida]|uniref:Uncharacterized protein n=1 Tax=Rotaria sordida TaxID=392033 RepID=A0A819R1N0_9BILA|nr:unnamed protein product [Rotaria sordida]